MTDVTHHSMASSVYTVHSAMRYLEVGVHVHLYTFLLLVCIIYTCTELAKKVHSPVEMKFAVCLISWNYHYAVPLFRAVYNYTRHGIYQDVQLQSTMMVHQSSNANISCCLV